MMTRIMDNRWVSGGLRLLIGAVFIYAGAIKMTAFNSFADSIATFRLLPTQLINLLALGLPLFEISVGGLLVVSKFLTTALLGALLLYAMFALALAEALFRGLAVDCGCFGSHGASVLQEWISLARDLFLGAIILALYVQRINARKMCVPNAKVTVERVPSVGRI